MNHCRVRERLRWRRRRLWACDRQADRICAARGVPGRWRHCDSTRDHQDDSHHKQDQGSDADEEAPQLGLGHLAPVDTEIRSNLSEMSLGNRAAVEVAACTY